MSTHVHTEAHELLDYFGRCPRCGYPASAALTTHRYSEGTRRREVIANCGLPCGWRAPVEMRRMTDPHTRRP